MPALVLNNELLRLMLVKMLCCLPNPVWTEERGGLSQNVSNADLRESDALVLTL
jgi:hypothetical protein